MKMSRIPAARQAGFLQSAGRFITSPQASLRKRDFYRYFYPLDVYTVHPISRLPYRDRLCTRENIFSLYWIAYCTHFYYYILSLSTYRTV